MGNFVSNSDANALMSEIGKKKLTVTDVMPLAASAANEGIPYLYLGATTQDFTSGSIYESQEVTPATDPKTYEWVLKYQSDVDLTYYKRIWGGTEAGWEALTDEEKANYEYVFFESDSDQTLEVVDDVIEGNMHPVTSNAVAEKISDVLSPILNTYGAKNMLNTIGYSDSGTVSNGVEYTVNPDGTVTANGTAIGPSTFYYFHDIKGSELQSINGCIFSGLSDGSVDTYFLSINQNQSPWTSYCRLTDQGNSVISGIPNDDTLVDCIIRVANGVTVTDKTFYAMIRQPGVEDDNYAPFAMTNKQLTDGYNAISRKFKVMVSNTFATAKLPDDWKTGYRFIYVLMNYGNMDYLLQPTVLPTESLAIGKRYIVSYTDNTTNYIVQFVIDSDNNVTLSKISGGASLTGAWFCLVR